MNNLNYLLTYLAELQTIPLYKKYLFKTKLNPLNLKSVF